MPDQAAGLRSLFARRRPSLLVAVGGDACKAAVAAHFAREAATAGRATVLIDGSPGQLANACGTPCRYELAQVLSGDRRLEDVLRPLTASLMLLPASRALARYGSLDAAEEGRLHAAFSGIGDAFAAAGTDAQIDLIVVNADDGQAAQALDAFGHDARVVVVASDRPSSLRAAYAEIRTLAQDHGVENFEVVVPIASDPSEAGVAFANLAGTAKRFLDIDLVDGGTVPIATPRGDRRGTVVTGTTLAALATPQPIVLATPSDADALDDHSSHDEVSHAAVH